jgi:hypothetical protein
VIRAFSLDHGELTGKQPSGRQAEKLGLTERGAYLVVRVPAAYRDSGASVMQCLAHRPFRPASCVRYSTSTRDVDAGTYVARHPPAYYGVVGAVTWVSPPGSVSVYLMRFVGSLIMAAFVATAITALRRLAAPKVVAVGLAIAITPMVLFVSSTVNPSSPEITASIAFWVCGLVLISRAHEQVDDRLVTAVGIAGCVLALSRQLGPLWLALIVLTMLGVSNRVARQNLARSRRARIWAAAVGASFVAQLAWDVLAKPLDVSRSGHASVHLATAEIIRITTGQAFDRYWEMIGWFGWLDTPSPALTWVPWTFALAFLVIVAVLWTTRRQVAVLLSLTAATIVVPIVIESATYSDAGAPTWQGRYTLPLAVGVPILAAFALSSSERGRQLATRRLLVSVGAVLGVAQIIAFAQNLRRYTVGHYGDLQFWSHAKWSPPLPPIVVTVAFIIGVAAFMWWLLRIAPGEDALHREIAGQGDERLASTEKEEVTA